MSLNRDYRNLIMELDAQNYTVFEFRKTEPFACICLHQETGDSLLVRVEESPKPTQVLRNFERRYHKCCVSVCQIGRLANGDWKLYLYRGPAKNPEVYQDSLQGIVATLVDEGGRI